MNGTQIRTEPVLEVFIAVRPDELAALSQAFATDATLYSASRSGHPDDDPHSDTPDLQPKDPMRELFAGQGNQSGFALVEVVQGDQRSTLPVRQASTRKPPPGTAEASARMKKGEK